MIKHHHHTTLSSTNTWAKTFLDEAIHPSGGWHLVTTDHQTHGYGKRGRVWQMPLGNLAMTLACPFPALPVDHLGAVSLASALAVGEVLLSRGISGEALHYKWPNDVLVEHQKIAGILVETTLSTQREQKVESLIVGVGVNLVGSPLAHEVRFPPTSLADQGLAPPPPQEVAIAIAEAFLEKFTLLQTLGPSEIQRLWLQRAWRLGDIIAYTLKEDGPSLKGIFEGLDSSGGMMLKDPITKETLTLHSADVGALVSSTASSTLL